MGLKVVHFALVSRPHCPSGAVHDYADIHARLPLVLDEFAEARLENPFHAPRGMTRRRGALKKGVEVRPFPEDILEFVALLHRQTDRKQLAKDVPPRQKGSQQQQCHDQLDRQTGAADEMKQGHVLRDRWAHGRAPSFWRNGTGTLTGRRLSAPTQTACTVALANRVVPRSTCWEIVMRLLPNSAACAVMCSKSSSNAGLKYSILRERTMKT